MIRCFGLALCGMVLFTMHAATPVLAQPLTNGLFISNVTAGGRELTRTDHIAHLLTAGAFSTPSNGASITLPDGSSRAWTAHDADTDGRFSGATGRSGYGFFVRSSQTKRPMMLDAIGHAMVYVNGEPRMGDPYGLGTVAVPILLRDGPNEFLFALTGRGSFSASLREPRAPVEIDARDATTPDLIAGRTSDAVWIGVMVHNTTGLSQTVRLEAMCEGQWDWKVARETDSLAPFSSMRLAARLPAPVFGDASGSGSVPIRLRASILESERDDRRDEAVITLRVRGESASRKETYNSLLDGSVQYYAVLPPSGIARPDSRGEAPDNVATGIVLSLHGAAVEATNQADSYSPKPDLWIVCPTNRHRYGFDWESWGREDALAVLKAAANRYKTDPARVYLTGHSMGGHGTWQLASLFPGRFAAAAPSAGWISFETYSDRARARAKDTISEMLQRAAATSDTLTMLPNLASTSIFILHGDSDDNVPVTQARRMAEELAGFHKDWSIHEEKGAGHWWDQGEFGPLPGAACTDYPPFFDMFARTRLPDAASFPDIDFTTVNPAVSGECLWAEVHSQRERLKPSRLRARMTRHLPSDRFELTISTVNIESFVVRVPRAKEFSSTIDGQTVLVKVKGDSRAGGDTNAGGVSTPVRFARVDGIGWKHIDSTPSEPIPPGTFIEAYNGFLLVYGTAGNDEENAWSYAKARFDAEQWSYRGNGRARLMSDDQYISSGLLSDPSIIYGNADTNRAWDTVMRDSRIRVRRGEALIGSRSFKDRSLGVLAIHKSRTGEPVGVIAGTDLAGARSLDRLPVFVSGVGVPEVVVTEPSMLREGVGGVVGVGMLGNDWSVQNGEWVWRE